LRFALLLLIAATAYADDRLDKAEAEMKKAHALMAERDFAGALERFDAARALAPEASGPYLGIGLSAASLDRCDRAIPALQEYLRKKTENPSPLAKPALQACQRRVTPPAPPPPSHVPRGGVHIESLPIGAEVRVDDERETAGRTPLDLTLAPGPHVFHLSQEGYLPLNVPANIVAGVTLRLSLQLEIPAPPPPPPVPRGRLELYVEPPPVKVLLNGKQMPGDGPTFGAEVPGGMYRVVIEKQGYDPEYRDVLVRPAEKVVQRHSFAPRMSQRKRRVVAAVAVVVPLVAVGLAVGLGVGLTLAPPAPAQQEANWGTLSVP
jgi:hypothetical protein